MKKVLNFINLHNLLTEGSKLLLAVSGGADSVGLVEILVSLKASGKINSDFHIAHINHLLRGEKSFEDEEYVKSLAQKHNLPLTCRRVDVKKCAKDKKLSIETAARELRLDLLGKIAEQNNCSAIATAHHRNDNAETVIHRLLRGTGFKGLAGIRPKISLNGIIFIRPLLCLCRSEIEDFLSSQNIKWQTDHTNTDCRFTRNRIRHRVIPYIQKQSTAAPADLLFELSRKTLKLYEKIEKDAKSFTINSAGFNEQHRLLQIEVIQRLLEQSGVGLQKFTNCHYNKIIKFIAEAKTGKSFQLPTGASIQKTRNGFFVGFPKKPTQTNEQVVLPMSGKTRFADWVIETEVVPAERINVQSIKNKKDNSVEYFDLDGIDAPLSARFRQNGDKFVPFGRNTPQKIGKFAASANQAFIIQDNKQILWLAPLRRSRTGTIAKNTTKILKIRVLFAAQRH